ncbi:MAG: dephospho-CoA kinase [Clostridiales bacterium]|nr:dephospho-CoA kinase [Clostridiales bacterium]
MNNTPNDKKTSVHIIGLTGGIASGKTVATTALINAGYTVIDADEVSRALFATGTDGERSMMLAFPKAVKDGRLDRGALRKIIAKDAGERQKLNALTHPVIIAQIKKQISAATPPVILSAPLLFEAELSALCDCTVCVHCPNTERINRLTARDGVSAEDAASIIAAQISDDERCTRSDYVVRSDRDIAEFTNDVIALVKRIIKNKEG